MATVEFLKKRVAGKEKEIEKLEKKMERILKAESTNWEVNPYYYNELDKKYTARDLEEAKKSLEKYTDQLATEEEKANSRNVEAILTFLENWKEHVREYYKTSYENYLAALEEYHEKSREYEEWCNNVENYGSRKSDVYIERRWAWRRYSETFFRGWAFIEKYVPYRKFDTEAFEKDLKKDADAKYDDIIERTNRIVGTITDAAGLTVGDKGELNGFVIGTRGKARVETIGAGGYNIQCFHFRTLIHEVK